MLSGKFSFIKHRHIAFFTARFYNMGVDRPAATIEEAKGPKLKAEMTWTLSKSSAKIWYAKNKHIGPYSQQEYGRVVPLNLTIISHKRYLYVSGPLGHLSGPERPPDISKERHLGQKCYRGNFHLSNKLNSFINTIKLPFTFYQYPTIYKYWLNWFNYFF